MKRLVGIIFVCMLIYVVAFAENVAIEDRIGEAQTKWDMLEKKYADRLTNQQRFAAFFAYDGIGMAHDEDSAFFTAINDCNSFEDFIVLIENGLFSTSKPFDDERMVLSKAETILNAAGILQPGYVFAQHYVDGPYKHTDCWKVIYGHFDDVDYGDGIIESEPTIDYTLYFCGDEYQLVAMIVNEFLDQDNSSNAFYLLN